MRRSLVLVLALILLMSTASTGWAQDGSPTASGASKLSGFGLPELRIQLTQDGVQVPTDVEAGLVLLVVENSLDMPAGVTVIQPPEGASMEEVMAILGPPPAASPAADEGAAPEGEEGPPPPIFYDLTWAGGAFAPPQGQASIAISLTAGEWLLATDPESGLAPAMLTVSDATSDAAAEVTADATVNMDEFQFEFPDNMSAGQQVWEVSNAFEQPHEMFITSTPRRLTLDEVDQLLQLDEEAPLPPGMPNPAEFVDVGGVAPISQDQTVYIELNLEPGAYVAICFMPDEESGMPHALKGMVTIFEVPEDGQEVAPPESPVAEEHSHEASPTS